VVDATGTGVADPDDPAAPSTLRRQLADRAAARGTVAGTPGRPVVTPRTTGDAFERSVAAVVEAIGRGEVAKVVLARAVDVRLDAEVDVPDLLRRWAVLEPACTVFSVPTPGGQFVGASPELLVERTGDRVRSRPLAGTAGRSPGPDGRDPEPLLDSAKDAEEHRLVVQAIGEALAPVTTVLDVPDRPELVHLHAITHLGTTVEGTLRGAPDGGPPSVLHLLARLHPTPAVGGVPRDVAAALIGRLEPVARGTYAGPVGWVDGSGDGRWMVGIRAATVDGASVRMSAGVGVVAGSDPRAELLETDLKLRSVFEALAPGVHLDTSAG